MRIEQVARGAALTIRVDGADVPAFEGESVAAAMVAHGLTGFRRDGRGDARGWYCNMGSCCECMVTIAGRRVRACMVSVADALEVSTDG